MRCDEGEGEKRRVRCSLCVGTHRKCNICSVRICTLIYVYVYYGYVYV